MGHQWDDLLVVTLTEFGRTSKENGKHRHGPRPVGSVMFVAGGGVKGGVYNCDDSHMGRPRHVFRIVIYLARKTDFRGVFWRNAHSATLATAEQQFDQWDAWITPLQQMDTPKTRGLQHLRRGTWLPSAKLTSSAHIHNMICICMLSSYSTRGTLLCNVCRREFTLYPARGILGLAQVILGTLPKMLHLFSGDRGGS